MKKIKNAIRDWWYGDLPVFVSDDTYKALLVYISIVVTAIAAIGTFITVVKGVIRLCRKH